MKATAVRTTPKEKLARGSALVFFAGLFFEAAFWDRHMQLMVFPLLAGLALAGWIWLVRHSRAVHGTETTWIGQAAPGYVELVGKVAALPGAPLTSPGGTPCCWYYAWDRSRIAWVGSKYCPSTEPFLLTDETGSCVVSPEGSGQIGTAHEETWDGPASRGHAWLLLPGDKFFAIGELTTVRKAAPELAVKSPAVAELPLLRKPGFGRVFWLATEEPETLGSNARFGAWMMFACFLYFAVGFVLVLLFRSGLISMA